MRIQESFIYNADELARKYKLSPIDDFLMKVYMPAEDLVDYEYFEGTDGIYIFTEQLGFVKVEVV